jgi:hypothetical protein
MSLKCFISNFNSLPERAGIPAVEISHIEEHTQLSVLLHEALELRNTVLVIGGYEFPTYVNEANLAAVFVVDLHWHLDSLFLCFS